MAQERPTIEPMTWRQYLETLTAGESASAVARRIGVDQSTVSRWRRGTTGGVTAERAAELARAYGRPVLEALVAAGFLSPDEAGTAPAPRPTLEPFSDHDLAAALEGRLRERSDLEAHLREWGVERDELWDDISERLVRVAAGRDSEAMKRFRQMVYTVAKEWAEGVGGDEDDAGEAEAEKTDEQPQPDLTLAARKGTKQDPADER